MAKVNSSTQALRALRWLLVNCHVIFKILTVVFTCTCTESKIPAYVKAHILNGGPSRGLGSSSKNTFHISKTNGKTCGDRNLLVAAGWNTLPDRINNSQELPALKNTTSSIPV